MAAVDYFLKLDGIAGESPDAKHKTEIELSSFSWGVQNSGGAAGGGSTGKVSIQDFHFTAKESLASPNLMLACAAGTHIKKATLTCRKAGGNQEEYLVIHLEDCLLSSFSLDGATTGVPKVDDRPVDAISINFTKISYIFDSPTTGQIVDVSFDFTPQTP